MVRKGFAKLIDNRSSNADFVKFQCGWRKVEEANGAVNRSVFFTVDVAFCALNFAVRYLVVVVVKQMVNLFQCNDLKYEYRQQVGGDLAICGFGFQSIF